MGFLYTLIRNSTILSTSGRGRLTPPSRTQNSSTTPSKQRAPTSPFGSPRSVIRHVEVKVIDAFPAVPKPLGRNLRHSGSPRYLTKHSQMPMALSMGCSYTTYASGFRKLNRLLTLSSGTGSLAATMNIFQVGPHLPRQFIVTMESQHQAAPYCRMC